MVRQNPCPRCGGQLFGWDDAEKNCLQCGHIVYSRNPFQQSRWLGLSFDFGDKTVPHPPGRGSQERGESK
jgi:hypothetical protein